MRADRRNLVYRPAFVAIHSNFLQSFAHDRAGAWLHLVLSRDFAAREIFRVLLGDVEIFFYKFTRRSDRLSRWIVKRLPRIRFSQDQIADQEPRDRAVRQAHSAVTS